MSNRMRIKSVAASTLPKNIILSGKGVARVKVGTELFDRCPIEDYSHQGVQPSTVNSGWSNSVDVFVGGPVTGKDSIQTLTPSGTPASGSFIVTAFGQSTAPLAFGSTAAQIKTAIQALTNPATGKSLEVNVTGTMATAVVVEFINSVGNAPAPAITVSSTMQTSGSAAVTVAVAQTQVGALPGTLTPDLELSGVFQIGQVGLQTSPGGQALAILFPVETVRNEGT